MSSQDSQTKIRDKTLVHRLETALEDPQLLREGEKVLVACSAGPDSVALFHLLNLLKTKWNFRLGVLHFNHGWRGRQSDDDEKFVRRLSEKYGNPFYAGRQKGKAKNGISLEEAARKTRYDFFVRAASRRGYRKIFLAHTQDDQAETVLMRVLQGTGLRGLSGIRPQKKIGKILFLRPLLGFSKKELLEFLKQNRFSFRRDATNQSPRFLRNRIRLKLFPMIAREFNPNFVQALARIPEIVKEENEILVEIERRSWQRTFRARRGQRLFLNRKIFLAFPSALQFRILDRALKILDPESGLNYKLWRSVRDHLGLRRYRASLPRNLDFELTPSKMSLYKRALKLHRVTQDDTLYNLGGEERGNVR